MKILYIAYFIDDSVSGVYKKINSQCGALKKLGHDCYLLSIKRDDNYCLSYCLINFNNNEYVKKISIKSYGNQTFNKFIYAFHRYFMPINSDLINLINTYNFDYLYIRHILPVSYKYISLYKKIKVKCKKYYEFYSYPYIKDMFQYKGFSKYVCLLFEYKSVERLKRVIDEFIVVNEVDSNYDRNRLGSYRVVTNGCDVHSLNVRKPPVLNKEIHILGLANLANHHGYDRIITGIAQYKGPYKIIFHVAGGNGYAEIQKLRNLSLQLGVTESVEFHEPMYGEKLAVQFDTCHVAAGTLALHRIGSLNGSVLKLREYCARGIPFFYGYNDEDFDNFDFSLRFSADDSPVDIDVISKFVEKMYSKDNHEYKMREYAEDNLDWTSKMKKIFT